MKELYTRIETDKHMEMCPVCGSAAELWRFATSPTAPATKVVMCSHAEVIGPQDGPVNEGCPLYMPNDGHYQATEREALRFWNDFAKALGTLRRKNNWKTHKALRASTPGAPSTDTGSGKVESVQPRNQGA